MSKKIISILLAILLIFSMTACSNKQDTTENTNQETNPPTSITETHSLPQEKELEGEKLEKVTERIIYEDECSKISVIDTKFVNDENTLLEIKIACFNKSSGKLHANFRNLTINDAEINHFSGQVISAYDARIQTISFNKDNINPETLNKIKSFKDIEKITIQLDSYHTSNTEKQIDENVEIHLNDETKNKYKSTLSDSIIYNKDECLVMVCGNQYEKMAEGYIIKLYIENTSKEERTFTFTNLYMDTTPLEKTHQATCKPGMISMCSIVLDGISGNDVKDAKSFYLQLSTRNPVSNNSEYTSVIAIPVQK